MISITVYGLKFSRVGQYWPGMSRLTMISYHMLEGGITSPQSCPLTNVTVLLILTLCYDYGDCELCGTSDFQLLN